MTRMVMAICVATCLMISLLGISSAQAVNSVKQAELIVSCQKIQQYLTLPSEVSAQQGALVALNIAIAQAQPLAESVDYAEVLRKANAFTTYGVQSDTFYYWNVDRWEGDHRSTYGYSGIRQTSEVEQEYTGSWVNLNQTLTTYNGDGTPNTVTQQEWQTSQWVNASLTTFTYAGGMTGTMLMQTWSGSAWVNFSRSTLTYSGGALATTITELWQTGAWVNSMKSTYTYSGGHISEIIMQTWTGAWVNSTRFTYTYNGSGWEMQNVTYLWQGGAWTTSSKHDYTHDAGSGNEILDLYSIAAGASWTAMEADTSKWSGNTLTEIVFNRILSFSVSRVQFTYDGNGNNTLELSQDWSGSAWVNSDRAVYVYQTLAVEVDNGRIPSVFELSQNYPNPFNPITAIRYSLRRPSQVNITVFNLLGQEVKVLENGFQSPGVYETTWDGTNRTGEQVASGIYFYRIKAGDNVETRKMLLLK